MERGKLTAHALLVAGLATATVACEAEHPSFYDGPATATTTPIPTETPFPTELPAPTITLTDKQVDYLRLVEATRSFADLEVIAIKNSRDYKEVSQVLRYIEQTIAEIDYDSTHPGSENLYFVSHQIESLKENLRKISAAAALCYSGIVDTACYDLSTEIDNYRVTSISLLRLLEYYEFTSKTDIVPNNPSAEPTPYPQT